MLARRLPHRGRRSEAPRRAAAGASAGSAPVGCPGVPAPFVHELRVRYGECDPQGIVFNANYLLYFDVVFTELWRAAVGPWQEMVARGVDAVVADATLSFRA